MPVVRFDFGATDSADSRLSHAVTVPVDCGAGYGGATALPGYIAVITLHVCGYTVYVYTLYHTVRYIALRQPHCGWPRTLFPLHVVVPVLPVDLQPSRLTYTTHLL